MVAEAQDNFFQDSFRDTLAIAFFEILRVASVEEVSLYEDVPLGLYYDELDKKYRNIFQGGSILVLGYLLHLSGSLVIFLLFVFCSPLVIFHLTGLYLVRIGKTF